MRPLTVIVAVAVFGLGCAHVQQVDSGRSSRKPLVEKQRVPRKARKAEPQLRPPVPRLAAPATEQGRPELVNSPGGLMRPEGPRLIQVALAKLGYLQSDHQTGELDGATSAALRKFQADRGVARTGSPDRETVRKLGLSPEAVFRSSASTS